jgi:transcriptional regulator with XRE-family HTH domain
MSSRLLPNYLRSHRKRLGLSQDEVAFLLGAQSGAKVSRYEQFTREPSLATALACEVIFQTPTRELLGGLYQEIESQVAARAKALTYRTDFQKGSSGNTKKLQAIRTLAALRSKNTTHQS